jgi:FkbM family methyltransferase
VLPGETVLDVGAYDGDTSLAYAECVGPEGRVHAFEPARENYDLLRRAIAQQPRGRRVRAHPVGCWSASGRLALRTEGRDPSQFQTASHGDQTINVVSIDDVVADQRIERVDWIKLDVEGAEHEVLLGARETLRAHRPKLAICVYHRPRDLWELPAQLLDLGLGYRLWLSHHSQTLYDTVCYALPREREQR